MKKVILVVTLLIGVLLAWFLLQPEGVIFGADSGALSPGTMADDATVGTVAWTNPNNAKVSDNVYATRTVNFTTSHYLKATNLGFTIPAGSTIDGILVEVEKKLLSSAGNRSVQDSSAKIVKADGTFGTTNKAIVGNWSTTESYVSYGSSSDLWGETWSSTEINDVDFGFGLSVTGQADIGSAEADVDHIRITVYYTEAAGTPTSVTSDTVFFE